MHKNNVQILLSTYNGEKHLSSQLDSILAQDYLDWELWIRDDCSSDNTLQIIRSYAELHPAKIKLLDSKENLGSTASFMKLIEQSTADYIMLCDQDDVWHPEKISRSLSKLNAIERTDEIALVYTDMEVVDEDLNSINDSFLKAHRLSSSWSLNPYFVFAQSMAAGCSMIFNSALRDRLYPVNAELFQHDHWILMHAAYYGKVGFINWGSVKYRQHATNAVGSHGISLKYFIHKLFSFSTLLNRWNYIRSQFQPKPNLYKIMIAKLKLNLNRLLALIKRS
jgi:glycosyltransferase involved in cell wall biosynthesis